MGIEIKRVGIIGAGQMGSGIAQVCAVAGLDVLLNDREGTRVESGLATIDGNLARQVAKGHLDEALRRRARERIAPAA
ncbi:3-hydroxyacyl-CoA dehydrogenase NAD-binding domain-containing protein, partial [Methylobacterium soli]